MPLTLAIPWFNFQGDRTKTREDMANRVQRNTPAVMRRQYDTFILSRAHLFPLLRARGFKSIGLINSANCLVGGLRWRSNGTINSPRPSDAARGVFVVIGVTLY